VEAGGYRRTVTAFDNGGDLSPKFVKVEREVLKMAGQYTVQVTVEAPPVIFK